MALLAYNQVCQEAEQRPYPEMADQSLFHEAL